jgi:hypothetical protein
VFIFIGGYHYVVTQGMFKEPCLPVPNFNIKLNEYP